MYHCEYENSNKMFLEPTAHHHGDTLHRSVIVDTFGSRTTFDVDGVFTLRGDYDETYRLSVSLFKREDLDKELEKIDTIIDQLSSWRDELYTKGSEYLMTAEERQEVVKNARKAIETTETLRED